jgi:hypoxanthine phosphoribosyltransferase
VEFLPVDPDRVIKLSLQLAKEVKESNFQPDVIVSIHRGGMVIARLLSDYLDVRDIRSVRVEHYTTLEKEESARIAEPLPNRLDGLKVLLVDDVSDTGESLKVAKQHLLDMGASEVRVATLHYKPWSSVKPDYFVEETDRWVVYFWEWAETSKYLLDKLKKDGFSEEDVKKILREEIGIPEFILRWVNEP